MMKELIFTLTTSTGGAVTLTNAPDGWDESLVTWERSDKYFGVFRSFTIPLKFVKAGATALRNEFYTLGTKGTASIVIERLDKVTQQYRQAYTGECQMDTYRDTDYYVEITVVDSGFAKSLKENGGTEYEVTCRLHNSTDYIHFHVGTDAPAPEFGCIDIRDLFKKLIDQMTDGGYLAGSIALESSILDALDEPATPSGSTPDPICLTTGRTFREAGTAPLGMIKTTFEDLFKSLKTFTGCVLGIEYINGIETIKIEPPSYFFDPLHTTYVGEVKTFNVSIDNKLTFNTLSIGWPAKEYTNYLMAQEPNATSHWKSPNATSADKLDLISKYRADVTGMLDIIAELTDSADDDIFFVQLHWTTNYGGRWELNNFSLYKQTGSVTEAYCGNALLTPRRCIIANQVFIDSMFYDHVGDDLVYTSGDNDLYNIEVKSWGPTGFGAYMKERDPITLATPTVFLPIVYDIEAALPADMINLMNTYSTRQIQFRYDGVLLGGYVMSVSVKLSGRSMQKIKLIASPSYDLTQLIR